MAHIRGVGGSTALTATTFFSCVSHCCQPRSKTKLRTIRVVALNVDTKSTGRSFRVMAQSAIDKIPPGPKLDALTAEKVFSWKNVHKHDGSLVGKKQDKSGHWRLAKVPYYSTNPVHAYLIEGRMKQQMTKPRIHLSNYDLVTHLLIRCRR